VATQNDMRAMRIMRELCTRVEQLERRLGAGARASMRASQPPSQPPSYRRVCQLVDRGNLDHPELCVIPPPPTRARRPR
jgi:hypothetical protein